jgi:ferrochelatase
MVLLKEKKIRADIHEQFNMVKDNQLKKIAVVLMNLGGPDSMEAIEPFLKNLFSDPDIFNLPFGQKLFAKIISSRRAPKVANQYKLIGGKSPINEWTEIQRSMLESELRREYENIDVFTAMRYWNPITEFTAKKVAAGNYDKVVLLPLYPHYSITTTGSSFNEWKRVYKGDNSKTVYIKNYYNAPLYIKAINERIDESLLRFPENKRHRVNILFSAHGTPVSLVKKGDPYSGEIRNSVETVMKLRSYSHQYHLSFQSKVGPVKWLEPATNMKLLELGSKGVRDVLVVPISFVSDHVETLFELNIEYRHTAEEAKIENYIVMTGLNDSKTFVKGLCLLVKNELSENKEILNP